MELDAEGGSVQQAGDGSPALDATGLGLVLSPYEQEKVGARELS